MCIRDRYVCDAYYKNRINKGLVLELLKFLEIGLQVVEANSDDDVHHNLNSRLIEGIFSYSNQLKHSVFYTSDSGTSLLHSVLSKAVPFTMHILLESIEDEEYKELFVEYCIKSVSYTHLRAH